MYNHMGRDLQEVLGWDEIIRYKAAKMGKVEKISFEVSKKLLSH